MSAMIYGWGSNNLYQLGGYSGVDKSSPVIFGKKDAVFTSIAAGEKFSLALDESGTIWACGYNNGLACGQASSFSTVNSPMAISGSVSYTAMDGGGTHCVAIDSDGMLWSWGTNSSGELGTGSTSGPQSSPLAVFGGAGGGQLYNAPAVAVSAGTGHSLAIDTDGAVWAWGMNMTGQLGLGDTVDRSSPISISMGNAVTAVSAGAYFSLILDENGTAWGFGENASGQCGYDLPAMSTPVSVSGTHIFTAISAGHNHSLAIDNSGMIWAWGQNDKGQLGNYDTSTQKSPVSIYTYEPKSYVAISAGLNFSLAIDSDGVVWAWGQGTNGQLDSLSTSDSSSPVSIGKYGSYSQIAAGQLHALAIREPATFYVNASGSNEFPYDTPAKGSNNLFNITTWHAAFGDTIEVVKNGTIAENVNSISIPPGVTIRSYGTDGTDRATNKPTIHVYEHASMGFSSIQLNNPYCTLENLRLYIDGPGSSTNGFIIQMYSDSNSVLGCEIYASNIGQTNGINTNGIGVSGCKVINSLFRNLRRAISFETGGACNNDVVFNNTIYNADQGIRFEFSASTVANTVVNNIVTLCNTGIYQNNTIVQDYNNVFNCVSPYGGTASQGAHNPDEDPSFVSVASGNFMLGPGSPCVDAGAGTGLYSYAPTTDIRGQARPVDIPGYDNATDGIDIGAYEMLAAEMDSVPPTNWPNYPALDSKTVTTASFNVKTNEAGYVYIVVLLDAEDAPTAQQVKEGKNSLDELVPAGQAVNAALTQNVEETLVASGLRFGTKYKAYVVAEDSIPNLQETPTVVPFTTVVLTLAPTSVSSLRRAPQYQQQQRRRRLLMGGTVTLGQ